MHGCTAYLLDRADLENLRVRRSSMHSFSRHARVPMLDKTGDFAYCILCTPCTGSALRLNALDVSNSAVASYLSLSTAQQASRLRIEQADKRPKTREVRRLRSVFRFLPLTAPSLDHWLAG